MAALIIALAIPAFFVLIGVEYAFLRATGRGALYRFPDTIACLSCGIGQQMTGVLWKAGQLLLYVFLFETLAPWRLPTDHVGTWVFAFLAYDHQYYWWHRTTHRSRLFWTTHVVHHQSEDYNLAVALRQAWFSAVSSIPFYAVLGLCGVPPLVFVIASTANTLYQFWIHTEAIGKLGPLEWVLNTPSHHRVHHAVDPAYIDKNYAGMLIVWDRLYGTFAEETTHPTYGTVDPFPTLDPLAANLWPLATLWADVRRTPGLGDKIRRVLGPPEWRPAREGGPKTIPEPEPGRRTFDPQPPVATQAYVAAWFVGVTLAVVAVLYLGEGWRWGTRAVAVTLILATTWVWAALLEGRPDARVLERLRLVALAATLAVGVGLGAWPPAVAALGALALVASAVALQRLPPSTAQPTAQAGPTAAA